MNVLIIHFRSAQPAGYTGPDSSRGDSAGTDGVSLEMMKRKALLEEMGHQVAICSAFPWADFPVADLEFDCEAVQRIMHNLYGPGIRDFAGEEELEAEFELMSRELERQLGEVLHSCSPRLIFAHNILSLPVHPAATVALVRLLEKLRIPCAAVHHDLLSEGAYKFAPTCSLAGTLLEEYFPPRLPGLSHWTINSRNKRLLQVKGIAAEVIWDTMDFDRQLPPEEKVSLRSRLRELYGIGRSDVVLMVGCRLVANKQIEVAAQVVAALKRLSGQIAGRRLYNGEPFTKKSDFVLVLAGRPERFFSGYRREVLALFQAMGTRYVHAWKRVRPLRCAERGFYALYPDMYCLADFVLYPTGWEGFGNQLLEALAAGLPTAVFEYPVFKEDIAPKGVEVVSLGDQTHPRQDFERLVRLPEQTVEAAARRILHILSSAQEYRSMASRNLEAARRHFGAAVLRDHLLQEIQRAQGLCAV